ncbi:MAG: TetR/AcrR family transcriptional regulator [Novosphingobium sp.]|nr:TetR/AcrR family transcriptional regulator [Novosphingobium sp.]
MANPNLDRERRLEIGRNRREKTRAKIIAAAFEILGEENGIFTRVEDVSSRAGITRSTFYAHFESLAELRDAVSYELTHEFLASVTLTISFLDDPCERAAAAIRFYLKRTFEDAHWGWSMINLSSNGLIFGAETHRQAELTVQAGMDAGVFSVPDSALGRDLVLGSSLAAMATIVRDRPGADFPDLMAQTVLEGLGVSRKAAADIAFRPLPALLHSPGDETAT